MRTPLIAAPLAVIALVLPAGAVAAARPAKAVHATAVVCKATNRATVRTSRVVKHTTLKRSARTLHGRRFTAIRRCPATQPAKAATTAAAAPTVPTTTPVAAPAVAFQQDTAAALAARTAGEQAARQAVTAPAPACCAAPAAPASTSRDLGQTSSPAVPASGLLFGTHAGAQWVAAWDDPGPYLDKVRATGVTALREDFRFDLVERTRGSFDWTRYDRLYAASAVRGMTILPVVDEAPAWADGSPYPIAAEYAAFVAAGVGRYGPNGTFWAAHPTLPKAGASTTWELWNEPYEGASSKGNPSPALYAKLAVGAADAGRKADPAARFLLEATPKSYGGRTWVDAMYDAQPDLNAHFDGVAVHAYGNDLDDAEGQFRRTMENVRASFVAHGAADKPFWVTETGSSTCTANSPDCVSEARQAELVTSVVQRMRTTYSAYVRSVFFFGYRDPDKTTLDPADSQDHYGLAHTDGTPKPAMLALQKLLV